MVAFAGNSLLCRLALKHTGIDAASFTSIRIVSGAITLWLITQSRGGRHVSAGSWRSALALFVYAAGFSYAYLSLPAASGALLLFGAVQSTMIGYGLWRGERFSFAGKHFRVRDAAIRQLPVQEPFVPVLIGGGGERVTLRQVARLADVSNFAPHEWSGAAYQVSDVQRKYEALRRHCEEVGRPYESVLRTHYTPLVTLAEDEASLERKRAQARIPDASLRQELVFATPGQAVQHFQALADAGVQYFLVSINFQDVQTVRLFAEEVAPAVHLPVAQPTESRSAGL